MSEAGVRSSLQAKKSVHRTIYAVPELSLSTSCETGKVKIRERRILIYILIASSLTVKKILVLFDKEAFKFTFK